MPFHKDLTAMHQIHDDDLVYADEAELQAASPASDYYHRFGYATSERTYWLYNQDGWTLSFAPQAGSVLSQAVVHDGAVVTFEGEIVVAQEIRWLI